MGYVPRMYGPGGPGGRGSLAKSKASVARRPRGSSFAGGQAKGKAGALARRANTRARDPFNCFSCPYLFMVRRAGASGEYTGPGRRGESKKRCKSITRNYRAIIRNCNALSGPGMPQRVERGLFNSKAIIRNYKSILSDYKCPFGTAGTAGMPPRGCRRESSGGSGGGRGDEAGALRAKRIRRTVRSRCHPASRCHTVCNRCHIGAQCAVDAV